MFIMTINVLLHSFYYNCIESKTESIQTTNSAFPLKKNTINIILKYDLKIVNIRNGPDA